MGRHITSPALHLIHHSANPKHWDKNLAHMFTFWDRLTGTLYLPTQPKSLRFGLGNGEDHEFTTVAGLYVRPFRKLVDRWTVGQRPLSDRPTAAQRTEK